MASVRDRGNGSYQMVFTFGQQPNGKPQQYTDTYRHPSGISSPEAKRGALNIASEWEHSVKTGDKYNPARTVNDIIEIYLQKGVTKLKENTLASYICQFKKRIIPTFGNYLAIQLTPSHINEYLELLQDELMAGSRHKITTALSAAYSFAVERGYLKESPCHHIVNPPDEENEEQWTMTIEQAQRYIAFVRNCKTDEDIKRILTFLSLTGLRIGECLGLSWDDINLDGKYLTVRHTLTSTNGLHLTKPKTKKSRRSIAIGNECVNLLRQQKDYSNKLHIALDTNYAHPEIVFPSGLGNYRDRHSVYISLKRITEGTEFDFMTLHKHRHVCATIMLNKGADIATVSAMLGHSSIDITAKVYAEVLAELKQVAAHNVEQALFADNKYLSANT